MILKDTGFTRVSALKIVGRDRTFFTDGTMDEDWLLVEYNGNVCKVGAGFYGKVDLDFTLPEKAIIIHMVIDERSENEYLRFPIFEAFYSEELATLIRMKSTYEEQVRKLKRDWRKKNTDHCEKSYKIQLGIWGKRIAQYNKEIDKLIKIV